MSVCPHASHFSQTSAGISSRSRRGCRGFFSFLNQAMAERCRDSAWRGRGLMRTAVAPLAVSLKSGKYEVSSVSQIKNTNPVEWLELHSKGMAFLLSAILLTSHSFTAVLPASGATALLHAN